MVYAQKHLMLWGACAALLWCAPVYAAGSLGVGGGGFYPLSSSSCALTQISGGSGNVNYTVMDCSAGGEGFGIGFYYPPDNPSSVIPLLDVHMGSDTGDACVTVEIGCCGDGTTVRNCDVVSYSSVDTADTLTITGDGTASTKQYDLTAVTPTNHGADRWCMTRVKRQTHSPGCTSDTFGADLRIRALALTW